MGVFDLDQVSLSVRFQNKDSASLIPKPNNRDLALKRALIG
jgi:hypothetical protein